MKKFYKVTLYKIESDKNTKEVGEIIVESGIFTAKEIMTQQRFRIYSDVDHVDIPSVGKRILFLVDSDFKNENIVTSAELSNYIDNFTPKVYPFSLVISAKKNGLVLRK